MPITDPHPDRHHLGNGFYGGFRPGTPDPLSLTVAQAHHMGTVQVPVERPATVDLTHILPPDDDQGQLGACGPFALGHVRSSESIRAGHADPAFAPLWGYWNYRIRFEGPAYVAQDTGVANSDLVKILKGRGWGRAAECGPYDPAKFAQTPPPASFGPALWYDNVQPVHLPGLNEMLDWLASGHTFLLGFTVYENIWGGTNPATGLIPMPAGGVAGGHDVCACGYSMPDKFVLARNQWGGDSFTKGDMLRFPFAYFDGVNVSDCWGAPLVPAPTA